MRKLMLVVIVLNMICLIDTEKSFILSKSVQDNNDKCLKDLVIKLIANTYYNVLISDQEILELQNTFFYKTTHIYLKTYLSSFIIKPNFYVILVGDVEQFNETLTTIVESEAFSSAAKFLVLIENSILLEDLPMNLWQHKLLKSFIVTVKPIAVYRNKLIRCGEKVIAEKIFSPNKTCFVKHLTVNLKRIMKNCPLQVITGYEPPFMDPLNETFKGIFNEMIEIFSAAMERELIIHPYDPIYLEELTQSFIYDSVLEDFRTGYADIFLGSTQFAAMELMDVSPNLHSNDLVFLVPRSFISGPVELLFSAQNFIPLGIISLMGILIAIVLIVIGRYSVDTKVFGGFGNTLFLLYGMMLGTTTLSRSPNSLTMKMICGKKQSESFSICSYRLGHRGYRINCRISCMENVKEKSSV
ncbi:hypothetical protein ABEB36_008061 [Hypothenemus hampei]|uniref:Ionotropic receptor n=1 Tax=Hypothenemus hampei TaxID=57062 RepID=A0ABD1EPM9_HYPHA